MICPACKKNQPMAFRCKSCGAELMRNRYRPSSTLSSGPGLPALSAPGVGSVGTDLSVAGDNPYATPQARALASASPSDASGLLASRGARLAAVLLDSILAILVLIPLFVSIVVWAPSSEPSPIGLVMLIGSALAFLAFVIYQFRLLLRDGQTIGKRVMKIRIVDYQNGTVPSAGKIIGMRYFVNGILGNIPLYPIVDHLLIFGEERRCVHDFLAGTKVVQV